MTIILDPERRRKRHEVVKQIIADCETDAAKIDGTPAYKMGPILGNMLAQIQALAKVIDSMLAEVEAVDEAASQ